jgi:hypothetical protein
MIVFNGEDEVEFTRFELSQKSKEELADLYLSNEIFRLELLKQRGEQAEQLSQLTEEISKSSDEILQTLILRLGETNALMLAAAINLKIQLADYE